MMVEGALNVDGKYVHAPVAEFAFPQGEMGVPRYGFDVGVRWPTATPSGRR